MRTLTITTIAILAFAITAAAQSQDEQQIMKIHLGLEQAFIKGDPAPFEAAIAPNYTFSGPAGRSQTREEMFKELRDEIAKPTAKNISETSDNIKIRVLGDTAYVTSGWTSVSQGLGDGTEPHTDHGQYTGIYEKMDGKWMLVREAFTEAPHDRKLQESEVLKASEAFDTAMRSRDKAAYERMLHADYIYTSEDGKVVTRAEDIAHFADMAITNMETSDKKVRVIGNTAAVETGMYHAIGSYKGKAFDETGRYTTTWIWKDLRWQVVADHNSLAKK
jgi:ketosteroid isomerase-like protein